jgi:hypothetical protein
VRYVRRDVSHPFVPSLPHLRAIVIPPSLA